jgi:hypothetical protein
LQFPLDKKDEKVRFMFNHVSRYAYKERMNIKKMKLGKSIEITRISDPTPIDDSFLKLLTKISFTTQEKMILTQKLENKPIMKILDENKITFANYQKKCQNIRNKIRKYLALSSSQSHDLD